MAQRAAEYFTAQQEAGANITHMVSSPLVRAQETASPTAKALGLNIVTDDRIIEAANRFQGLSRIKERLKEPKYWSYVVNPFRPSWGEPLPRNR